MSKVVVLLEPKETKIKKRKDVTKAHYTVFCCQGDDCAKNGAKETLKELRTQIREAGLRSEVHVIKTQCADKCKEGPVVIACSGCSFGVGRVCGAVWYRRVKAKDVTRIVQEHLQGGEPVQAKLFHPEEE